MVSTSPAKEAVYVTSGDLRFAKGAVFRERPLAFLEGERQEQERIHRLRSEDPIALQDALNTSRAFVDAVKEGDIEEMQSIVANAEEGEFLQAFTMQAFVLALKSASLAVVKELVNWGVPVGDSNLSQAIHLVCEITNRDNFGDSWRIVQLLVDGNSEGKIDINEPRIGDGWTPLCIACADACLPMAAKLLEFDADPNVITTSNATPISLAKQRRPDDTEEQREARGIIVNMLRYHGGQEKWRDALQKMRAPKKRSEMGVEVVKDIGEGRTAVEQAVSKTHTRFAA